jgi:hypothetical protein
MKYSFRPNSQNINKSKLNKFDVFGSKFGSNIFIFIDQLLLIFWDEENTFYKIDFYCFFIMGIELKCD